MGPDFRNFSGFLSAVSDALSVELEELIEFKEGMYWLVLNIVISI